jgi:hypothetical protein
MHQYFRSISIRITQVAKKWDLGLSGFLGAENPSLNLSFLTFWLNVAIIKGSTLVEEYPGSMTVL